MNKIFFKTLLFVSITSLFASCDKDFNNIGSDIIGDDHFGMERYDDPANPLLVNITQKNIGPIQTNNLEANLLGIHDGGVFGNTTANFATQVQLSNVAPTIDPALEQQIESVVLYIPYYIKSRNANSTTGSFTYELEDGPLNPTYKNPNNIKLSIYQNGQDMSTPALNNILPGTKLFSDQDFTFDLYKVGTRLNEDTSTPANIPASENDNFSFTNSEYIDNSTTPSTYTAPGIRVNLNKTKFQQLIFNPLTGTVTDNLKSNSNFTKYFKGLYFKSEISPAVNPPCMNLIDFKKGTITIKYKEYLTAPIIGQPTPSKVDKTIVLNLSGNTVSLLNNATPIPAPTDRIVLKGGEGSIAQINLFGTPDSNGKFKVLEIMKKEKYLINEANLVFYTDKTNIGKTTPSRVFLYDLRNKRPIIDYFLDNTTSATFNGGKLIHNGIKEDISGSTTTTAKYKIRLTNHIRNLVSKDSTNVSLGLAVCYNISNGAFYKTKNAPAIDSNQWLQQLSQTEKNAYFFPVSTIMNPLGLILYNNTMPVSSPDYDKRVQLEIWYTKPN